MVTLELSIRRLRCLCVVVRRCFELFLRIFTFCSPYLLASIFSILFTHFVLVLFIFFCFAEVVVQKELFNLPSLASVCRYPLLLIEFEFVTPNS